MIGVARLTALLALLAGAASAEPSALRVGFEAEGERYDRLAAAIGGDRCPTVEDFTYGNPALPSRVEGEPLILCNALRLGGGGYLIEAVPGYNYNRGLADAISGRIDLPTQTIWSDELAANADTLLASAPVIARGEWVVGLYTAESRADVLAARDAAAIRKLVAAVPRNWTYDWQALESLGLAGLVDVQENQLIPLMIRDGRVDFTLHAFGPPPDFARPLPAAGFRMLPIPGIKLALPHSRHFAVSRKRPDAAEVVAAIDRGLAELRRTGELRRVLVDVGVIRPEVETWTALEPAIR